MLMTLVDRLRRRLADHARPGLAWIGLDDRRTRHLERVIAERISALS